jgi:hypothetical protein
MAFMLKKNEEGSLLVTHPYKLEQLLKEDTDEFAKCKAMPAHTATSPFILEKRKIYREPLSERKNGKSRQAQWINPLIDHLQHYRHLINNKMPYAAEPAGIDISAISHCICVETLFIPKGEAVEKLKLNPNTDEGMQEIYDILVGTAQAYQMIWSNNCQRKHYPALHEKNIYFDKNEKPKICLLNTMAVAPSECLRLNSIYSYGQESKYADFPLSQASQVADVYCWGILGYKLLASSNTLKELKEDIEKFNACITTAAPCEVTKVLDHSGDKNR